MAVLLQLISVVCGVGSLVCFIMVLIKMFQNNQTGLGIACIVLVFVCGIGALIAFIYGWMKSAEWDIKNVMLAWTGCIVVGILVNILVIATAAPAIGSMPIE